MKRIMLFVALFSFMSVGAYAQQPTENTMVFGSQTHDFGNITQKDGAQTCTFTFTNTGKTPIIVQNVTTSCGCTTSGWTKEPVLPGATGFVKATYNPTAITTFDKSLTVSSNGTPNAVVLSIKGTVVESPAKGK